MFLCCHHLKTVNELAGAGAFIWEFSVWYSNPEGWKHWLRKTKQQPLEQILYPNAGFPYLCENCHLSLKTLHLDSIHIKTVSKVTDALVRGVPATFLYMAVGYIKHSKKASSWSTQTILEHDRSFHFFHFIFCSVGNWIQVWHTLGRYFITDLRTQHGSFRNPTYFVSLWTTAPFKPELNPNV